MGGLIPDYIVEDIRQRADIAEIVSQYITLEKRGKNLLALCPFHQEKTPSFNINPEKQIFHCFGCGVGGNVFKFLMMVEGISFPEAVKNLASRVGVVIPEEASPADVSRRSKQNRAWEIYSMAKDFYRMQLEGSRGQKALQYLEGRNINENSCETFQLGYAPPGWDPLTNFLLAKGVTRGELVKLGLSQAKESGGCYDRFRDRIIFPIWDPQGRIVGFGGRTMGEDNPKYLNSPEGEYFNKGQLLYGLHISRRGIREQGFAVVLEGYIDVVSVYQRGVTNAVASLGTAFTRQQGKLLMNYTHNVVIAYDGDAAGVKAAVRAAEIIHELGCQVRIANIPQGKDPDDFIQARGILGWQDMINKALTLVEFKLLMAVRQYGLASSASKKRILQEVLPNLAAVASSLELEEAVKQTATVLQVNWETVLEEIRTFRNNNRKNSQYRDISAKPSHNIASNSAMDARAKAEESLIRFIIEDPKWLDRVIAELGVEFFENQDYQVILLKIIENKNERIISQLFNKLEEKQQVILSKLLVQELPTGNYEQVFADLIHTIRKSGQKAKLATLLAQLSEAERTGDSEQVLKLRREINLSIFKSEGPERGVAT